MRKEVFDLRKSVYSFYHNHILVNYGQNKVLEVGAMDIRYTPIKEFFVDAKAFFDKEGISYKTCDSYEDSNSDFVCSILDLPKYTEEKFDVIIACEVIEHIYEIWELQDIFYNLLNKEGVVYLSSPFYFYQHNPFPDYWRITKFAYEKLFNKFKIEFVDLDLQERQPLHYKIILKKCL